MVKWMNGPKCGFVSQRKMTTVLLYVGKMITGGNSSMLKYLSAQQGLKFQECCLSDTTLD